MLLSGLLTLIGLVVHIGPERIYRAWASLGAVGVAIMLVPSTRMYFLDCLGWIEASGDDAECAISHAIQNRHFGCSATIAASAI